MFYLLHPQTEDSKTTFLCFYLLRMALYSFQLASYRGKRI